TFFDKRRPKVGHDDMPNEHHAFVGKVNQHRIMRFTTMNRDQLELRSADVQLCSVADRNIRLVALDILRTESLSEERFRECSWPIEFLLELFLIIRTPIKLGMRVKAAEIGMAADMVPVCVSDEDGR